MEDIQDNIINTKDELKIKIKKLKDKIKNTDNKEEIKKLNDKLNNLNLQKEVINKNI